MIVVAYILLAGPDFALTALGFVCGVVGMVMMGMAHDNGRSEKSKKGAD